MARKRKETNSQSSSTQSKELASTKNAKSTKKDKIVTLANIVTVVMIVVVIAIFLWWISRPPVTPTRAVTSGNNKGGKKINAPEHWEQSPIWMITKAQTDRKIFSVPVVNGAGYTALSIIEKIPHKQVPKEKFWVDYGVEKIRYVVLEPSIGVQGFSCVSCNESGECFQVFNADRYKKKIPPCLMEPNQGMLNLVTLSDSIDCAGENHALMLGLGNGAMSGFLDFYFPKTKIDVVEINEQLCDPNVLNLLGNHPNSTQSSVTLFNSDAEIWVAERCGKQKYSIILADMAGGDASPSFMYDKKWVSQVKCLLKEDGIFVANLLGPLHADQEARRVGIAVVDAFYEVFGPEWKFSFMETGYFNRIFYVAKKPLEKETLQQRSIDSAERCGTPEMIRGTDFWHEINSSSTEMRQKWITPFSSFQTRAAWLALKASNKN